MPTFAFVPEVPGRVIEVYVGNTLFPLPPEVAAMWFQAPDGIEQNYTYDGTTFSPPPSQTLQEAKSLKISSLNASCANAIISGFTSSALGSVNTYPAKEGNGYFDQTNLVHSATSSLQSGLPIDWSSPLWCENSSNQWNFTNHTASQVQQVAQDFLTAKNTYRNKLNNLVSQVNAATTIDEVNQISW